MDKTKYIGIVLMVLLLIGFYFYQVKVEAPRAAAQIQAKVEQTAVEATENQQTEAEESILKETEENSAPLEEEQFYEIKTNKIQVKFTNRGGDVVSYGLLEHNDTDTGMPVEMVDNITESNRAFSISFGDENASVINDSFETKVVDDKTIVFYKNFSRKDELGNECKFRLAKRYTFMDDEYVFKLDVSVDSLDESKGLNFNGCAYTIRTSPQIGPHFDRKKNRYEVREFLGLNGSKKFRKNFSDKYYSKDFGWVGVGGKYFAMLIKPENPSVMDKQVKLSTTAVNGYANSQVLYSRNAIEEGKSNDVYYIYVGPRRESDLVRYNTPEKNGWNLSKAKFNQALNSSSLLAPIQFILRIALQWINKLVHNWGVSIIVLTLILKILLFPLNKKSATGTIKMQELQPKMQALQEKYKNDQQKLSIESAKLYKEAGYNPVSGCLPMIIQMLILFAMYYLFNNYFEFRGASFVKGWVDDLSVGDSIFSWEKRIPLISGFSQNNLRLLPIIYVASQLFNGMITQYGGAGGNQNKGTMWFMMYGMPIMFFFILYNAPSGLLLYWSTSNILQIGQQLVINRIMKKQKENSLPKNKKKFNYVGGDKKQKKNK